MKLSNFNFDLPKELLAEYPSENRDEARLMVIHRKTGKIEHKLFKDVIDYFDDGDVFVLNNTKVFPARLYGNKEKTKAKIEVFLLRELSAEQRLGDVLVDPCFADAHGAADQEYQRHHQPQRQAVGVALRVNPAGDAQDGKKSADRNEGRVHGGAGTPTVGDPASQRSQQRCGKDEGGGQEGGGAEIDPEYVLVVGGQDCRVGHVGPEDDHVVEAEAPHPDVLERRQHLGDPGARPRCAPDRARR